MIKICKAKNSDSLLEEWHKVDVPHYGKPILWQEKQFRFKAVENDSLIGTIEGKYSSGVIYIDSLIVAESARGRGIATMLVDTAELFGKKLGAHRIWLITGKAWEENTFYKKLGFEQIGNLPDFHFHTDFVIYTKKI